MKKILLIFLFSSLILGELFSQKTITGQVLLDSDKSSIPGVTVSVKGTSTGTITDLEGNYSLSVPEDAEFLIFSFVGMEKQEVSIGNQTVINVFLIEETVDLGDVVVVGYSTDSEKLISASFSTVNAEELQNVTLKTVDGVLQGKTPGVQITQNSGTPGGGMSVRLRGSSSINAGNEPLYVVDGIPITTGNYGQVGFSGQGINALSDINPDDIASVTVLRDASAAAIYGARATNGVILITTKRGANNETKVDFGYSYGIQQLPKERKLNLLNAQQWNEYRGTDVQNIDTDWLDEIFRNAPTTNVDLSVSGGNEKTKFYSSGTFYKQDGIVIGTSYDRLNYRLNIDHKINNFIDIGTNFAITRSFNKRVEGDQSLNGPLPNAISLPAIYPVFDEDGNYDESGPYANPVAIANEAINNTTSYRSLGNIYANFKIAENLNFKTTWGADIYNLTEHSYDPPTTRQGAKYNGLGIEATSNVQQIVSNNVLQYIKSINKTHNFDILLGYSFEINQYNSSYIEGIDFPHEELEYLASAGSIRSASASSSQSGIISYFGQFKYNYKYKYLFSATARYDGSSKFGANNKYGFFPAGSVAWRLSEEDFLKSVSLISEFKIRASMGLTGNDGIPSFSTISLYQGGANYGGESGISNIQLENPDLRWETTRQMDFGFDLAILNERVSFVFDYYNNKTTDLLLARPLPLSSGFSSIMSNIGSLENKGLELAVTTVNIDSDFNWTTTFNISGNRNKVLELYNNQPIEGGRGNNRIEVGQPLGIFYGYNMLGVDPSTGLIVYEDVSGDNQISDEDRTVIGNPNPKFTGGLNNSISFKGLEFSIFLQYVYGNDVYNGTRVYIESLQGDDNQTTAILDRWEKPGDETYMPKIGDLKVSSRFIEDGSFLRVKSINLSYNFPHTLSNKLKLNSLTVYASVQNAYTFTNYSGMDPEVNYSGDSDFVMGTDFFTYPQARSFNFGIKIGL